MKVTFGPLSAAIVAVLTCCSAPSVAQDVAWVRGIDVRVKGDGLDDARAKAVREAAHLGAERLDPSARWGMTDRVLNAERWDGMSYQAMIDVRLSRLPEVRLPPRRRPEIRRSTPSAPVLKNPEPGPAADETGASLSRPAWILLVHAYRTPKGDLVLWDRNSDWAKIWRVPGMIEGIRYVPVSGDAEDRERVKSSGGHVEGLSFLVNKYRAPAVALVVRDAGRISVTAWKGAASSGAWKASLPENAEPSAAKAAGISLLSGIFQGKSDAQADRGAEGSVARVVAWRDAEGGTKQYQVTVRGPASAEAITKLLTSIEGLSLSDLVRTPEGLDLVIDDASGSSEPIERRLSKAGLETTAASAAVVR